MDLAEDLPAELPLEAFSDTTIVWREGDTYVVNRNTHPITQMLANQLGVHRAQDTSFSCFSVSEETWLHRERAPQSSRFHAPGEHSLDHSPPGVLVERDKHITVRERWEGRQVKPSYVTYLQLDQARWCQGCESRGRLGLQGLWLPRHSRMSRFHG